MKLSAVCALVGIGAGIYAFASGTPADKTPSPRREPALTVTAATAREVDWPVTVSASGTIAAWQESSIGAEVGSYRLTEVDVNVGDTVKRGQILARMVGLRDSGGISEQEVLQYVTQARTSRAQVDYARAVLEHQRIQLRDTEVRPPDDGVISARDATVSTVVTAGQTLFRLIRRNRLEWRGELTHRQVTRKAQHLLLMIAQASQQIERIRLLGPSALALLLDALRIERLPLIQQGTVASYPTFMIRSEHPG
ncbi:efflux RND transporter periplasmic adaptor subunit [Verminephrobacter aporrectodeae]|uniref:efflux RND transporter periplasmic adaptor subunit n=1 Tax=Verminephrobacter aporrectodeae TaxID=1110389 RepID=UPI002243F7F5|nr:HlyD family efflux transporter periplasmic adaptor subunit [Verminephrobacter aporrectodeae]